MSEMTPQHPAAPETETDANGLRELLRLATPAPWSVAGVDGQGFAVHRGEHETVALYCDRDNARLIAAAVNALPALLAALDAARERVRVVEGERDAARAKVGVLVRDVNEWMTWGAQRRHAWQSARRRATAAIARAESAEAAHEAEKAAHERLRAGVEALADEWAEDYPGPNAACNRTPDEWATGLRSLLGGGEAR